MEQKMGFAAKVANSITKPDAYGCFLKETVGKAIIYLVLLTLIFESINLVRPVIEYNNGINQIIRTFNMNAPNFTIKNGQISVDGDMPIISKDNGYIFIVDTTGKTDETALDNYYSGILVLKDRIIQKESSFQKRVYSLKDLGSLVITKSDVQGYIPLLKIVNIFIVLFGYIGFFAGKLISALVLAVLALIVNAILKTNREFKDLYKLSIYALTLPVIIKVFLSVVNYNIPYFFVIYYGIALFYIWKALSITKNNENTQPPDQIENM